MKSIKNIFITIFEYKFYFYEPRNCNEPIHVHVSKYPHKNASKIWILEDGTAELENNNDEIPSKDLKRIIAVVSEFSEDIITLWEKSFGEITYYNEKDENTDYEL